MQKRQISRLLIESALIAFSVLFALFIDRAAEKAKLGRQKRLALERIHTELRTNQQLVAEIIKVHQFILNNLDRVLENEADPLARQIMQKDYLEFSLLSEGKSIYPRLPTRTSWEAALSTGIITEFDYRTVEILTGVYSSQETIVGLTLQKIVDDLFDIEALDRRRKLLKFRLEFSELIGQEHSLLERIAESLESLQERYNLPPAQGPKSNNAAKQ